MNLTEEFIKSWEWEAQTDIDDWLNSDTDEDPLPEKQPDTLALLMVEEGLTLWNHPGWIKAIYRGFEEMLGKGKLIKARLLADWLLETLPEEVFDTDIRNLLMSTSEGHFYDVNTIPWSEWPRESEYYLKTLNLRVAKLARVNEVSTKKRVRSFVEQKFKPGFFDGIRV